MGFACVQCNLSYKIVQNTNDGCKVYDGDDDGDDDDYDADDTFGLESTVQEMCAVSCSDTP